MITVYKPDGNVEFYEYATFDGNVYSTAKVIYYDVAIDETGQCYVFVYEPYLWEVTVPNSHSLYLSNDIDDAMNYALKCGKKESED